MNLIKFDWFVDAIYTFLTFSKSKYERKYFYQFQFSTEDIESKEEEFKKAFKVFDQNGK